MNDIFTPDTDAYEKETTRTVSFSAPLIPDENKKNSNHFCVYIGPSILGLLSTQQVFRGTKEDALRQIKEAVKKYPQYAPRFMIPDDELPRARLQIRQKGTLLYTTYQKFLKVLREGGKTDV